ncbi:MAG: UDP-N-acetylmuramate dehydrogenase [Acidobacteria bacterium]|nr:UDP-N-acetylmuramate dehydrogenase [Acidobacteriota bacterium]
MRETTSFLRQNGISYRENYPVQAHTAYKVGGNAELAVFPASLPELRVLIGWCRSRKLPFFLIGGGANIIVSDDGLPGITIFTENLNQLKLQNGKIVAQCGASMETLALFAAEHGISGFEFLYDIPGSVGGALIMNAGNNDGEMKNVTCLVQAVTAANRIVSLTGRQCEFGYRTSRFKEDKLVVLQATFNASDRRPEKAIRAEMNRIKEERHRKFPMEFPNGGSVFKRPPGDYAGRLIEVSGCGGLRVGNAQVSTKHRGFIVNLGNATASDIRGLIALVQKQVKTSQGVALEREQIFLPEDTGQSNV